MPDAPTPDPEATLRPGARGTPVVAGGHYWLFADYVPAFDPVWDALYDANLIQGAYGEDVVRAAAVRLLVACHDLAPDDAAGVVLAADAVDLVPAVEAALLGPRPTHRTWSDWARAALWCNGIDPDRLPPADRLGVLDMLVATRRAVPPGDWVSAAEYAATMAGLRALAGGARQPGQGDGAADAGDRQAGGVAAVQPRDDEQD